MPAQERRFILAAGALTAAAVPLTWIAGCSTSGAGAAVTARDRQPPPLQTTPGPSRPGVVGGPVDGGDLAAADGMPGPIARARNWAEYRVDAARRLVRANRSGSYMGVPPEPLLAIPVLEVYLRADGQVERIAVMRVPGQAVDTVEMAKAAIMRASPFGPVSHLPRPWKFAEVFLYDNNRRFKPRTLD